MPVPLAVVDDGFKSDLATVAEVLLVHIAAIGPISDKTPEDLKALLQSDIGLELYVKAINAHTQKQGGQPLRAVR